MGECSNRFDTSQMVRNKRIVGGNERPSGTRGGRRGDSRFLATTALVAACAAVLPSPGVAGDTISWTGSASGNWFDTGNWSIGRVPTADDTVEIETDSPNTAAITGSAGFADIVIVGSTGTAALAITDGGSLTVGGVLAISEGGEGTVTVDGTDASLTVGDEVTISDAGTGGGTLVLANGGSLAVGGSSILSMGNDKDATSSLVIGAASGLTAADPGALSVDTVIIAAAKDANFVFNHTATADDPFEFTPAIQILSTSVGSTIEAVGGHTVVSSDLSGYGGDIYVEGAALTLSNSLDAGTITIGDKDKASQFVVDGGNSVTADDFIIGKESGSTGSVTISDSSLDVSGDLSIGDSGTGTLVLAFGSPVTVGDGDGTITIAHESGSTGTLAIGAASGASAHDAGAISAGKIEFGSGTGTLIFNHTADSTTPFELSVPISGKGTLAVEAGFTKLTADNTDFGGAITVDGGELEVTGALKVGSITVGDTGTGTMTIKSWITVDASNVTVGLQKGASGTLNVVGGSAQNVTTLEVSGDMVVGSSGSGFLSLANDAEIHIGDSKGTLTIAKEAGSDGTLVIGALSGDSPSNAGYLYAAKVEFGDGDASVVFNHKTSGGYNFTQPMTGSATLTVEAGNTNLTGDNSAFSGNLVITGGQLTVDDTLSGKATSFAGDIVINGGALRVNSTTTGSVTINSGEMLANGTSTGKVTVGYFGTLTGHGTNSGNVTVQAGGTIEPDTELTTGSVTFEDDSIFAVSVDSKGNADLLHSTGKVTVKDGATVSVVSDAYAVNDSFSYTVITPDGGRDGTFSSVSGSTALVTYTLNYIGDDVILTQTTDSFSSVGTTANHASVGGALDSLPTLDPVVQHTYGAMTEAAVLEIYDALSGEVHASVTGALMENDRNISEAINRRLAGGFFAPAEVLAQGSDDPDAFQNGAWVAGYGGWNHIDATAGTAAVDNAYGGVVVGLDRDFGEHVRLGVFGAYGHTSLDQSGSTASADVDSLSGGLYGRANYEGAFANFGGLATWHGIETDRDVAIAGTGQNLTADYDANSWQLFGEAGYAFEFERAEIEPFGGVSFMQLNTDGFTETGGSAALAAASDVDTSVFTTLGLRAGFQLTPSLRVQGSAGWRHAFGDVDPSTTFTLAGSTPFAITGAPIARDELVVGAGLEVKVMDRLSIGANYGGQFGDGAMDNQVEGRLVLRF